MNRESKHSLTFDGTSTPGTPRETQQRLEPAAMRRMAIGARADCAAPRDATLLASDDGALTYTVKAAGARLFIQRSQRRPTGTLAVQCLLIAGRDDFRRWCAAEPTRFEHPLLFDRLRRCGNDVFDHTG